MDGEEALPSFIEAARDLLDAMASVLLNFTAANVGSLPIDRIFRAAHTTKGPAGLFGLQAVVDFTPDCESALDLARAGQLTLGEPAAAVLLTQLRAMMKPTAGGTARAVAAVTVHPVRLPRTAPAASRSAAWPCC